MVNRLAARMESERRKAAGQWAVDPAAIRRKRQELLARLTYNPDPVSLRPRLLREERFPAFIRRTYRLQINPDDETGAYLHLPRHASRKQPVPVLLGLHEHGGQWLLGKAKLTGIEGMPRTFREYQDRCYGGQLPADYFASNGFAVLTIDQLCFGSRALWRRGEKPYHNGRTPISAAADLQLRLRMRYEQSWLHRALLTNGVIESEICLYDNRRSIDFLETIPEVDANRLGAFGLSMGCMHCHHVAAFDQRIKASVRSCWSGDFNIMIGQDGPRGLGTQFMFAGINAECHVPELVALSHPNAVLISNGKQDTLYPLAAQEKCRRETMQLAKGAKRGDKVRWSYFDGPHCFHPPQQREALDFFREFLG
jgi:dienelactone hydrolase